MTIASLLVSSLLAASLHAQYQPGVQQLAISPSGMFVAEVSRPGIYLASHDPKVKSLVLPGSDSVASFAFTPDSKRMVASIAQGGLAVWDVATGSELFRLKELSGRVAGFTLSPDGRLAALGYTERQIEVWDLSQGRLVGLLPIDQETVQTFWSYRDGPNGQRTRVMTHDFPVDQLCFSPDGACLATTGVDFIHLWDIPKMKLAHEVSCSNIRPLFGWKSDSRALIDFSGIRAWDATTGEGMLFEHDSRNVFGTKPLRVRNSSLSAITDGDDMVQIEEHSGEVYRCHFGESTRHLATSLEDWPVGSEFQNWPITDLKGHLLVSEEMHSGHVAVWSLDTGRVLWRVQ